MLLRRYLAEAKKHRIYLGSEHLFAFFDVLVLPIANRTELRKAIALIEKA